MCGGQATLDWRTDNAFRKDEDWITETQGYRDGTLGTYVIHGRCVQRAAA